MCWESSAFANQRAFAIQKHNRAKQLFQRRLKRDYELFRQIMLYLKIPGILLSLSLSYLFLFKK